MKVVLALIAASMASTPAPAEVAETPRCKLCKQAEQRSVEVPLRVEVDSGLNFSRLALTGRTDGSARIDPETSRKLTDAGMVDLGGMAVSGRVRVTGEPRRYVRIDMPPQVMLRSAHGAEAELSDFQTNLEPMPRLDDAGTLEFNFGGRLSTKGSQGGNFRGRIPIRVEYD